MYYTVIAYLPILPLEYICTYVGSVCWLVTCVEWENALSTHTDDYDVAQMWLETWCEK